MRRYERRNRVERTISWLFKFRRIVIRSEWHPELFEGFAFLSCLFTVMKWVCNWVYVTFRQPSILHYFPKMRSTTQQPRLWCRVLRQCDKTTSSAQSAFSIASAKIGIVLKSSSRYIASAILIARDDFHDTTAGWE